MFIIKFENDNCWIAPWEGDPGRTLDKESAKKFKTEDKANKFIDKIKQNNTRTLNLIVEPI